MTLAIYGGTPHLEGFRPVSELPLPGPAAKDAVLDLLDRGEISLSPIVEKFEAEAAAFFQTRHAVCCNNGTAAIYSALFALGVGPGDEVIVPSYTFMATATPVVRLGAIPIFADVDPESYTLDPEVVSRLLTSRTRALIAVHVWGNPAPMEELSLLARRHSLAIIEDASHAHGASLCGRPVGSWGTIGCFSLQGNKLLSGGEGGLLVTNDTDLFHRVLSLGHYERLSCLPPNSPYYALHGTGQGLKFRIHPFAAALARCRLGELPQILAARQTNAAQFAEATHSLGIVLQRVRPSAVSTHYKAVGRWPALEHAGVTIDRLVATLRAEGVAARRHVFGRLHYEPLFRNSASCRSHLPVSEDLYNHAFEMTILPSVVDAEYINRVAGAFGKIYEARYLCASGVA